MCCAVLWLLCAAQCCSGAMKGGRREVDGKRHLNVHFVCSLTLMATGELSERRGGTVMESLTHAAREVHSHQASLQTSTIARRKEIRRGNTHLLTEHPLCAKESEPTNSSAPTFNADHSAPPPILLPPRSAPISTSAGHQDIDSVK